jgi:hypothetical protein
VSASTVICVSFILKSISVLHVFLTVSCRTNQLDPRRVLHDTWINSRESPITTPTSLKYGPSTALSILRRSPGHLEDIRHTYSKIYVDRRQAPRGNETRLFNTCTFMSLLPIELSLTCYKSACHKYSGLRYSCIGTQMTIKTDRSVIVVGDECEQCGLETVHLAAIRLLICFSSCLVHYRCFRAARDVVKPVAIPS